LTTTLFWSLTKENYIDGFKMESRVSSSDNSSSVAVGKIFEMRGEKMEIGFIKTAKFEPCTAHTKNFFAGR